MEHTYSKTKKSIEAQQLKRVELGYKLQTSLEAANLSGPEIEAANAYFRTKTIRDITKFLTAPNIRKELTNRGIITQENSSTFEPLAASSTILDETDELHRCEVYTDMVVDIYKRLLYGNNPIREPNETTDSNISVIRTRLSKLNANSLARFYDHYCHTLSLDFEGSELLLDYIGDDEDKLFRGKQYAFISRLNKAIIELESNSKGELVYSFST